MKIENMSDEQTSKCIREWCSQAPHNAFSWPTDPCGYDQHVRFVEHRNKNWGGGTEAEFVKFALAYADSLGGYCEPPKPVLAKPCPNAVEWNGEWCTLELDDFGYHGGAWKCKKSCPICNPLGRSLKAATPAPTIPEYWQSLIGTGLFCPTPSEVNLRDYSGGVVPEQPKPAPHPNDGKSYGEIARDARVLVNRRLGLPCAGWESLGELTGINYCQIEEDVSAVIIAEYERRNGIKAKLTTPAKGE